MGRAFAVAGNDPFQVLFVPTSDTRRVLKEMLPQLPPSLGGGPITTLINGCQFAVARARFEPQLSLEVISQSKDAASAEALREMLATLLKSIGQMESIRKVVPHVEDLLAAAAPRVEGDRLALTIDFQGQKNDQALAALCQGSDHPAGAQHLLDGDQTLEVGEG